MQLYRKYSGSPHWGGMSVGAMTEKNQDAIAEELWRIFSNVKSWLEYAERKNTYIFTFVALQITLIKLLGVKLDHWQILVSIFVLVLSVVVTMLSFLPRTRISEAIYSWVESSGKPRDADNLLFYGDIVKYSVNDYITALDKKYFEGSVRGQNYLEDLCCQVVVNSGIANSKFQLFKIAATLMAIGEVFFILSVLRV